MADPNGIINPEQLIAAIERRAIAAASDVVQGLDDVLSNAISAPIYNWPNETVRSNGQVVGSPRDIIDTGTLDASQTLNRQNNKRWQWVWNPISEDGESYALAVHEGYVTEAREVKPGRPWTRVAIVQYQPEKRFAAAMRRRFK